jgi:hypothetical protein
MMSVIDREKGKINPVPKYHTMKTYRKVKLKLYPFLTSALESVASFALRLLYRRGCRLDDRGSISGRGLRFFWDITSIRPLPFSSNPLFTSHLTI